LREDLERRGLPPTRENLIAIGNELRSVGGAAVLAERIRPRLDARDVVDSIRNPAEVETLRRLPGFLLIGVSAPLEVRFSRAGAARGRPRRWRSPAQRKRARTAPIRPASSWPSPSPWRTRRSTTKDRSSSCTARSTRCCGGSKRRGCAAIGNRPQYSRGLRR